MENAVLLAELHKLLILFCYIKKSVREHNQLASCLIYARALPAHPYNMYLLIVLSVRSIIESVITGRGNPYKLFVNHCRINARKNFFCERVIKVWNGIVCHRVLLILNHCHHLEIHKIMLISVYIHDVLNAFIVLFYILFYLVGLAIFSRSCVYTITE